MVSVRSSVKTFFVTVFSAALFPPLDILTEDSITDASNNYFIYEDIFKIDHRV